jgi:hypothetical protein
MLSLEKWFVLEKNMKNGPYDVVALREKLIAGEISLETVLVREGGVVQRKVMSVEEIFSPPNEECVAASSGSQENDNSKSITCVVQATGPEVAFEKTRIASLDDLKSGGDAEKKNTSETIASALAGSEWQAESVPPVKRKVLIIEKRTSQKPVEEVVNRATDRVVEKVVVKPIEMSVAAPVEKSPEPRIKKKALSLEKGERRSERVRDDLRVHRHQVKNEAEIHDAKRGSEIFSVIMITVAVAFLVSILLLFFLKKSSVNGENAALLEETTAAPSVATPIATPQVALDSPAVKLEKASPVARSTPTQRTSSPGRKQEQRKETRNSGGEKLPDKKQKVSSPRKEYDSAIQKSKVGERVQIASAFVTQVPKTCAPCRIPGRLGDGTSVVFVSPGILPWKSANIRGGASVSASGTVIKKTKSEIWVFIQQVSLN